MRRAKMASLPVGTGRKSGEVTIARISETSSAVSSCGENRGHADRSSSTQARAARRHALRREGERRMILKMRRRPRTWRERSMARSNRALSQPWGTRRWVRSGWSGRNSTKKMCSTADRRATRFSRFATRTRSAISEASMPGAVVMTWGTRLSQPATVERGTPMPVAMVAFPVSWTSWTRRWS